MLEWLESLDGKLLLLLNSFHSPFFDFIMYYISKIWVFFPLFIYWVYLLYKKFTGKKFIFVVLSIGLLIALTDQSATQTKESVKRYRPTKHLEIGPQVHVVNDYRGGDHGFFSGHAANTFGLATFLFLIFRGQSAWLSSSFFIFAALSSYSRIYLGVHYPADILVGTLVGIFWAFIVFLLFQKVLSRYFNPNPLKEES